MSDTAEGIVNYLRVAARRFRVTATQLEYRNRPELAADALSVAGEFTALAAVIDVVRGPSGQREITTALLADIEKVMQRADVVDLQIGRKNFTTATNHQLQEETT